MRYSMACQHTHTYIYIVYIHIIYIYTYIYLYIYMHIPVRLACSCTVEQANPTSQLRHCLAKGLAIERLLLVTGRIVLGVFLNRLLICHGELRVRHLTLQHACESAREQEPVCVCESERGSERERESVRQKESKSSKWESFVWRWYSANNISHCDIRGRCREKINAMFFIFGQCARTL